MKNVDFISENIAKKKKFDIRTSNLDVDVEQDSDGWEADIKIKTLIKSMAFNTKHGSFAYNKIIEGKMKAVYNNESEDITVHSDALEIGETSFKVDAKLGASSKNSKHLISLFSSSILWKSASSLVSNNISSKLNKFDFKDPFDVRCDLQGDFTIECDPFIHVITYMKNNELNASNEWVKKCSFTGNSRIITLRKRVLTTPILPFYFMILKGFTKKFLLPLRT